MVLVSGHSQLDTGEPIGSSSPTFDGGTPPVLCDFISFDFLFTLLYSMRYGFRTDEAVPNGIFHCLLVRHAVLLCPEMDLRTSDTLAHAGIRR